MKTDDIWVKVLKIAEPHKAEIAKEYLREQHDIVAVVVNKQDSSYPFFGLLELYVSLKDANIAKIIVEHELSFDQPI